MMAAWMMKSTIGLHDISALSSCAGGAVLGGIKLGRVRVRRVEDRGGRGLGHSRRGGKGRGERLSCNGGDGCGRPASVGAWLAEPLRRCHRV